MNRADPEKGSYAVFNGRQPGSARRQDSSCGQSACYHDLDGHPISLTLRRMAVDGLTGQAKGGWGPPADAYAVCVPVVGRHGPVFLSP
jgi:hypothetical protein